MTLGIRMLNNVFPLHTNTQDYQSMYSIVTRVSIHVSTTLHILANRQNVVGWRLVLNYMQTPPTHYYLESSGQAAHMNTHPKLNAIM